MDVFLEACEEDWSGLCLSFFGANVFWHCSSMGSVFLGWMLFAFTQSRLFQTAFAINAIDGIDAVINRAVDCRLSERFLREQWFLALCVES